MILFTKQGCEKCDLVKRQCGDDLIVVYELDGENAEALAELAYHELVSKAEKTLPLLVDGERVYEDMPGIFEALGFSEENLMVRGDCNKGSCVL